MAGLDAANVPPAATATRANAPAPTASARMRGRNAGMDCFPSIGSCGQPGSDLTGGPDSIAARPNTRSATERARLMIRRREACTTLVPARVSPTVDRDGSTREPQCG